MKTSTNTLVILKAIDLELRALLKKDLQHFRAMQDKMMQENKRAQMRKAA